MSDEPILRVDVDGDAVTLDGEVDASSVELLEDALAELDPSTMAALDLAAVSFIDSTGLRALLDGHQRFEAAGGALRIVAMSAPVERLIDIAGVTAYLHIAERD